MVRNDYATLRPAREDDLELLNSYALAEGMDNMPGVEGITVAVNGEDIPVGFIRLLEGRAGVMHVNPVVVTRTWQGYGVGRLLVEDALEKSGELRLVSRGSVVGFYEHLGFEPIGWEDITAEAADDCPNCAVRAQCAPQPMRAVRATSQE